MWVWKFLWILFWCAFWNIKKKHVIYFFIYLFRSNSNLNSTTIDAINLANIYFLVYKKKKKKTSLQLLINVATEYIYLRYRRRRERYDPSDKLIFIDVHGRLASKAACHQNRLSSDRRQQKCISIVWKVMFSTFDKWPKRRANVNRAAPFNYLPLSLLLFIFCSVSWGKSCMHTWHHPPPLNKQASMSAFLEANHNLKTQRMLDQSNRPPVFIWIKQLPPWRTWNGSR